MKAKLFHKNYSYLLILISLLLNTALFSCKMKSEQYSFSNKLELIDALISQNYFSDAVDELKKLEKQTSDSWSFISIYKRYKYIDEQKRADLIIKKALKELPKNPELISLYSMSLLEQNNLDEAIKTSKALIGTKYASIYSQAILQKAISEPENKLFTNQEYFSIYYDAYLASQNPIWIKNCAVIALLQGNYAKATEIAPTSFANSNDAYFWATILYDGTKFIESLDALSQANALNQNLSTKNSSFLINLSALESDCYMAISDMQQAEQTRQKLLLDVDSFNINQKENKHLPIIYVNSAIWAINNGMQEKARELLSHAVTTWEDFVPALIAYADFAYNVQDIDFLLLTHAHIDHSGKIPKLYNSGYSNPIFCTKQTYELCQIMLPDSGHIQELEVEWLNKKRKREGKHTVPPLYTAEEATECLKYFNPVDYHEFIQIDENVKVKFVEAGHMLGSSMIEVWVYEDGKEEKVVFTAIKQYTDEAGLAIDKYDCAIYKDYADNKVKPYRMFL